MPMESGVLEWRKILVLQIINNFKTFILIFYDS